jgi:hypothetical protein
VTDAQNDGSKMSGDLSRSGQTGASGRLILLLGSPRSGTTWLAKILDTYAGVLYLHEPLRKFRDVDPESVLSRVAEGKAISSSEHQAVLAEMTRAKARCVRPPFFPKSYRVAPPWLLHLAWLSSGLPCLGPGLFGKLYNWQNSERHDVLLKEVDWHPGLSDAEGLDPEHLIIIVRHPCAVVCSRLTGMRLGLLPGHNRAARVNLNADRIKAAGFSPADVKRMSDWEFYALDWLLENQGYRAMAARHCNSSTVTFESLCHDPVSTAEKLFLWLGWKFGRSTHHFIRSSTSGSWSTTLLNRTSKRKWYYGIYRDSEAETTKWRHLLRPRQIEDILAVVRSFPLTDWAE